MKKRKFKILECIVRIQTHKQIYKEHTFKFKKYDIQLKCKLNLNLNLQLQKPQKIND